MKNLRIAVPTDGRKGLDEKVAEHFGRCRTYTFLNANGKIEGVISNTSEHLGGKGLPPELIRQHGADILLCRDLGPKALNLCENLGVAVYVGQAETVKQIFIFWLENKLKKAGPNEVCAQHKTPTG